MVSEKLRQYKHEWYLKHREEYLRKSAEWHKLHPEKTLKAQLKWNHKNRAKCNKNLRRFYRNHKAEMLEKDKIKRKLRPDIAHAHDVARSLSMAESCEFCDVKERLERHHPDYAYPKIFVTACKDCHAVVDKEFIDLEVYNVLVVENG